MIYKITPPPVTLYGEAADDFLASVGVELYEEHVIIGESTFAGADGEAILNENGVYLYEDHIVLEGQQAEEYKARKAKEKKEEAKQYDKYDTNGFNVDPLKNRRARGNVGNQASLKQLSFKKGSLKNHYNTKMTDDIRKKFAEEIVEKDRLNRGGGYRGKGMEVRKKDGVANSWYRDQSGRRMNDNDHYSDKYADKDRRIAHNAARDAANRHLRRHTKTVKTESTIFKSIDLI